MAKRLIILGAGGNASDILDIVDAINARSPVWEVVGLLDDAAASAAAAGGGAGGGGGVSKLGVPVVGKLKDAAGFGGDVWFVNSIGSDGNHMRRGDIIGGTGIPAERFATLVHPAAGVSRRAVMGPGSYACYGVSVGGGAKIGMHVHLGAGCLVGHDAKVDDYSIVAPGAVLSGFVEIGRGAYVGAGAAVRQMVKVGDGALIGMGSVVIRDVAAGTMVVGNPVRELQRKR